MSEKISLHVLGVSTSQLKGGAYALILTEDHGKRSIPVVIGASEAQSIAIALERISTPRPLTHDLFVTFAHAFGVRLREVFIYEFEDGIFSSQLTFEDNNGQRVVVDARTSDAVAIAMRTDTPIYTTEEILKQTGFVINDDSIVPATDEDNERDNAYDHDRDMRRTVSSYHAEPKLENLSIEELERTLQKHIDNENYEEAAKVSDIINNKKKAGGHTEA